MKSLCANLPAITTPASYPTLWILSLALATCLGSSPVLGGDHIPTQTGFKPEMIYKNNCSVCHGDRGDGRSRASTSLVPPPRDLTTAADLTREKMIHTVTNGKPGTAMTSWKTQLSAPQIEAVVDYVRSTFMQDVIEQRLSYGRLVYGHNCASCHGERGQGVKTSFFKSAPRSFLSSQAVAELTRERIVAAVTNGVSGTAMPGYADKLSAERIEYVADYIREVLMPAPLTPAAEPTPAPLVIQETATSNPASKKTVDMQLPLPDGLAGEPRTGEQFFMGNCSTCHGTLGDGQGPRAYFMATKPRNFLDDYSRATLNRPFIFSAITNGRPGTEMPAWGKVLTKQEIANLTEFVFQAFIQPGTQPGAK